jgi:hypothetical protein
MLAVPSVPDGDASAVMAVLVSLAPIRRPARPYV